MNPQTGNTRSICFLYDLLTRRTYTYYYPELPSPRRADASFRSDALPDAVQTFKRSFSPASKLEVLIGRGIDVDVLPHCSYLKLILKARAKLPVFAGTVWRGVRGVDLRVRSRLNYL